MKVAVVYNEPAPNRPDSVDVLEEVKYVTGGLGKLGFEHRQFAIGGKDTSVAKPESPQGGNGSPFSISESIFYLMLGLKQYRPHVIVNLVEGIEENHLYQHFFTILLEFLKYPFTGSGYETMLTTTDKIIFKSLMNRFRILTPGHTEYRGSLKRISIAPPWIVKPALEDASVGIETSSVFRDAGEIARALPAIYKRHSRQPLMIEQYIEGREFNVSLLELPDGTVEVLPVAEIIFRNWPKELPKIVGYRAKWDKRSFEYSNTVRKMNPDDAPLSEIRSISLNCWKVFDLQGYARVDLRLDADGRIYVLEINANPCISEDSGFVAALQAAGYSDADFVKILISDARRE